MSSALASLRKIIITHRRIAVLSHLHCRRRYKRDQSVNHSINFKMKINLIISLLLVSILSCAQETPKVKHVSKRKPITDLRGVKVINADDPVCHMKTAEFIKDTAVYKRKIYGFCSDHCKAEFKKNPVKYAVK